MDESNMLEVQSRKFLKFCNKYTKNIGNFESNLQLIIFWHVISNL
jgi:hypothetical protein